MLKLLSYSNKLNKIFYNSILFRQCHAKKTTITCPKCKRQRPHAAKGLCNKCYLTTYNQQGSSSHGQGSSGQGNNGQGNSNGQGNLNSGQGNSSSGQGNSSSGQRNLNSGQGNFINQGHSIKRVNHPNLIYAQGNYFGSNTNPPGSKNPTNPPGPKNHPNLPQTLKIPDQKPRHDSSSPELIGVTVNNEILNRQNLVTTTSKQVANDFSKNKSTFSHTISVSEIHQKSRSHSGQESRSDLGQESRSNFGQRVRSHSGEKSRNDMGQRARSHSGQKSRNDLGQESRNDLRQKASVVQEFGLNAISNR